MARLSSLNRVLKDGDSDHVLVRGPIRFDGIRIREYATTTAESVSKWCNVRTGRLADSGNWTDQSVPFRMRMGEGRPEVRELAKRSLKTVETDQE